MPDFWDSLETVEAPTGGSVWDNLPDATPDEIGDATVSQPIGQPPALLTPAQRKAPGMFDFAKNAGAVALYADPKSVQFKEDLPAGATPEIYGGVFPTETRAESLAKSKYKTPEELLKAYKESRGWLQTQAEQAAIGLGTGTMTAMAQPVGTILGKITGDTSYLDQASKIGKDMAAIGAVSEEMPYGQFTNKLAQAAASIMPTIMGGAGLGFAGAVGAGSAGSMSQTFLAARDAALAKGATEEEAQASAFVPTVASGLSTALATVLVPKALNKLAPGMFGEGVESIGAKAGDDLVKKTGGVIKDFFTNFTKGAIGEVPEEVVDAAAQGVIEQLTFNPDKTLDQIVGDMVESGQMAFFLGGTVQALSKAGGKQGVESVGAIQPESSQVQPTIIQDPVTVADAASASLLAEAEASDSDEVKTQLVAKADFFANPAHQEALADSVQEIVDLQEEAKAATPERVAEIEQELASNPLNGITDITPDNADAVQALISERIQLQQEEEATNVAIQATAPVVAQLEEQGLGEAAQILKDNNKLIIKNAVRDKFKASQASRLMAEADVGLMNKQPIPATETAPVELESESGVVTAQEPVIAPEAPIIDAKSADNAPVITADQAWESSPEFTQAEEAAMAGDEALAEQIETQFRESYVPHPAPVAVQESTIEPDATPTPASNVRAEPAPAKVQMRVLTRSKSGKVSFKTKEVVQSKAEIEESLAEAQENDTVYEQLLDCLGRKAK